MNLKKMIRRYLFTGDQKRFLLFWIPILLIVVVGVLGVVGRFTMYDVYESRFESTGYVTWLDNYGVLWYFVPRGFNTVFVPLLVLFMLSFLMYVIVGLPSIEDVKKGRVYE